DTDRGQQCRRDRQPTIRRPPPVAQHVVQLRGRRARATRRRPARSRWRVPGKVGPTRNLPLAVSGRGADFFMELRGDPPVGRLTAAWRGSARTVCEEEDVWTAKRPLD